MKRLLVIIGLLMVGLLLPANIAAQEATESTAAANSQAILQKQRLDEEIEQLTAIYRGQLTEYRQAEKEFQIDRDQYQQLGTLASINEVIESTRKVMRLRSQVLTTYFELLRVSIIAAEGIELSLKEAVVQRIEAQQNWLRIHQESISAINDREEFNQLADTFTNRQDLFEDTQQEASSILAVGGLQDVTDRLTVLAADLADLEASKSNVASARAIRETNRVIQSLEESFVAAWGDLTEALQEKKISGFYNTLTDTLNPVYSDLNKLVSFLDELLRAL